MKNVTANTAVSSHLDKGNPSTLVTVLQNKCKAKIKIPVTSKMSNRMEPLSMR